jgi:endonuclease YncB( thermonuclease family)
MRARLSRVGLLVGVAVLIALAPASNGYGQRRALPGNSCRLEAVGAGKISAIVDGRSFLLDDGREVRLPGIDVPLPPVAGETGPRAEAGNAAREALASMVAGEVVELRAAGRVSDRYSRILAHAYYTHQGIQRSAAHELLAKGFARVSSEAGECAVDLLAGERPARESKLGLWAEPYYAIVGAERFTDLLAERGHFTVVEGKVLSVRESGGTIYMNFGRRWSEALTVTISKRNERNFAAAGLDPKRLENRRVRVRGWIEERNGPRIEALRPEQIEIAER